MSDQGKPTKKSIKRATIRDVAALAGVSRSTASRALTGHGYVAPAVKARVHAAAKEAHYVVDVMARSLKQQTSRTIGVVVSDLRNSFYAEMAAGAARVARKAGYAMFLVDDDGSPEQEQEAAEAFVALRVAGVILTPLSHETTPYLSLYDVPTVEVDRQFTAGKCDAVVVDNKSGAFEATKHLLDLGHRRIAFLIDETDWTTGRERYDGYSEALIQAGVPLDTDLIVQSGWSVEQSQAAILPLLLSAQPPTAVFAANNILAEGSYRAVYEAKKKIPEDISLLSFDDAPWMSMVHPGMTAVAQDPAAMGEAAVERLLARIKNPTQSPRTIMLPTSLVLRSSTSRPANA